MQTNVLDYFSYALENVPDKIAFADEQESLSFRELYDRRGAVATWLLSRGATKQPIVVFMNKHPKEIAAFFGVIAAGSYYVPIDEEMPSSRIQLILDNVQSPVLIADRETVKKAEAFSFAGELVLYEEIAEGPIDEARIAKAREASIDTDPIYIVFTSGSTGVPKGVTACHRSVIDYIEQLSDTLGFDEDTVFGNQSPLYFDACLKELYPTLKFGATTYLIPKSLFMMPVKLVEYLNEKKINTICWVVSALTTVSSLGAFKTVRPETLRSINFGSEVFPIRQLHLWQEAAPEAKFVNLYGPTEGTGMCCYYRVDRPLEEGEVIPIGRPFRNTEILLLNEKNELAADGEEGEICIRGTGVTLGYYKDPERTAAAYVQNPLNTAWPETIYRTGDIGKKNERGELVFVSRKDYQIKHMGHRIELGEIEANAQLVDGIYMAGCVYDDKRGKIVLYYTGEITPEELIPKLKEKLPRYMIPNRVRQLEEMPRTANGKLDRVALKKEEE